MIFFIFLDTSNDFTKLLPLLIYEPIINRYTLLILDYIFSTFHLHFLDANVDNRYM